ncbi:solute carrier family 2, facilitated glucose transporter member 2-like isoform X2 [Photinus pyralis]|uniref:solute carrier family 2, facilitated glucose transporter member 2-like isoform X2 n=1 Tax=Photinus pyralis TaxID=7054 RepID=UPI001267812E|nr:solute carrier family 2, facilitated glucose transporter member 2-like isoform X2 [Photinus pyralis]
MESTDELDDLDTSSELHINPYSMTEEELLKKSKQRNISKLIVQSYVVLTACISAISFGTSLGWPMSQSNVPKESCPEQTWAWSLIPLGCSVGLSFSFYMVKTLGPKKTMLIDTPFYMLSYIGVAKGTVLCNFFIGICSIVYFTNAENLLVNAVHRTNLKYALIIFRTSRMVGFLIAYLVRNAYGNFLLAMTCLAIPLANALLLLFLPESPRFLYDKSENQCRESIQWYQGPENVYTTLLLIRADYEESKNTFTYMFLSKSIMKAILVIVILNFFRVCSGYHVHIIYRLPYYEKSVIVFSIFADNLIFAINLINTAVTIN